MFKLGDLVVMRPAFSKMVGKTPAQWTQQPQKVAAVYPASGSFTLEGHPRKEFLAEAWKLVDESVRPQLHVLHVSISDEGIHSWIECLRLKTAKCRRDYADRCVTSWVGEQPYQYYVGDQDAPISDGMSVDVYFNGEMWVWKTF